MAMLLYMLECNYGFVFHRERRIIRATGDTVFVDGIILIFKSGSCIQRNVSFREMFVITKSVTGKKALIEFCGIECSISEEGFGLDQWMFEKEVFQCRDQKFWIMYTRDRREDVDLGRILPELPDYQWRTLSQVKFSPELKMKGSLFIAWKTYKRNGEMPFFLSNILLEFWMCRAIIKMSIN